MRGWGVTEVGGEVDYIPIATLSPPERQNDFCISEWEAMRVILMFH